jgi:hypothetical protein
LLGHFWPTLSSAGYAGNLSFETWSLSHQSGCNPTSPASNASGVAHDCV